MSQSKAPLLEVGMVQVLARSKRAAVQRAAVQRMVTDSDRANFKANAAKSRVPIIISHLPAAIKSRQASLTTRSNLESASTRLAPQQVRTAVCPLCCRA